MGKFPESSSENLKFGGRGGSIDCLSPDIWVDRWSLKRVRAVKHTQSSKSRFATGMENCLYFGKYFESSEQEKVLGQRRPTLPSCKKKLGVVPELFLLAGLQILAEIEALFHSCCKPWFRALSMFHSSETNFRPGHLSTHILVLMTAPTPNFFNLTLFLISIPWFRWFLDFRRSIRDFRSTAATNGAGNSSESWFRAKPNNLGSVEVFWGCAATF